MGVPSFTQWGWGKQRERAGEGGKGQGQITKGLRDQSKEVFTGQV